MFDLSELPPMEGYIATWSYGYGGVAELEFNGETARTLYTWFPGSSIIRPDKVCSRGLKVPPTVKRVGGMRCERYVSETGQPATYKCFTRIDLATGRFASRTEEFICGLPEGTIKTPEEEDKDFRNALPIGYQPAKQKKTLLDEKRTPITGNSAVSDFFFSGEAAQMLYEATPENLTVPKGKVCITGAKITPTVRRSNGLRCSRTPSTDKKSATYSCYTHFDITQGWNEVASEEILCRDDPDV